MSKTKKLTALFIAGAMISSILFSLSFPVIKTKAVSPILESPLYTVEAEDGEINGSRINGCSNASGRKKVDYLDFGSSVTLKIPEVQKEGIYTMRVYYMSETNIRSFDITVGDNEYNLPCTSTGNDDSVGWLDIDINLKCGDNNITFTNKKLYAPNLDKIEIYNKIDKNEPTFKGHTKFESSTGNKLVYNYKAEQEGTYAFVVCTNSKKIFNVDVNGNEAALSERQSTDDNEAVISFLDLKTGDNNITVSCNDEITVLSSEIFKVDLINNADCSLAVDKDGGTYSIVHHGHLIVYDAEGAFKLSGNDGIYTSSMYDSATITTEDVSDKFGKSKKVIITSKSKDLPDLVQNFYLCSDQSYFLFSLDLVSENDNITSNWLAPLYSRKSYGVQSNNGSKQSFLRVPYDNDAWVEYILSSINNGGSSHEVTSLFDPNSRNSFVVGSIEHDTWKSAINVNGTDNHITDFVAYSGCSDSYTKDISEHGSITGKTVSSAKFMAGWYDDWKDGMDSFGDACTTEVPKKKTASAVVPAGWNSWGVLAGSVNYSDIMNTSDYIKNNLQDIWKNAGKCNIYINIDANWESLVDRDPFCGISNDQALKNFVKKCKDNGQNAGIYFTPFAVWYGADEEKLKDAKLDGSDYSIYDAALKNPDGSLYGRLDGGWALDPTHPGTIARIDYMIKYFKDIGFKYVKLDFLSHGAAEGNHFNTSIKTGTQAYNYGMSRLLEDAGDDMFINESIAPIFPYQYADGRRISCDAWYSMGSTCHVLNNITYGFWENRLYRYTDPDHIVIYGPNGEAKESEARARITSGVIAGTSFLLGDNLNKSDQDAQDRFNMLKNQDVMSVAFKGKMFHPVDVSQGLRQANAYYMQDGNMLYIALFNPSENTKLVSFDMTKYDIDLKGLKAKSLWTGKEKTFYSSQGKYSVNSLDADLLEIDLSQKRDESNDIKSEVSEEEESNNQQVGQNESDSKMPSESTNTKIENETTISQGENIKEKKEATPITGYSNTIELIFAAAIVSAGVVFAKMRRK